MTVTPFRLSRRALAANPGFDNGPEFLAPIIDRLLKTVSEENEKLVNRRPIDYRDYNLRKSQGLLELSRLLPSVGSVKSNPSTTKALGTLVEALKINKYMLDVQLRAARRISEVIAKVIQDGQSDGTYSALSWRLQDE
jgi:hypothetical protein